MRESDKREIEKREQVSLVWNEEKKEREIQKW